MSRHATVGFNIELLPQEPRVIVGDLYRPVAELDHAPPPLKGMREIVYSGSYKLAARRYMIEMQASGASTGLITERLHDETLFTLVRLKGELAMLPEGAALEASTPDQARICERALLLARRREVEGFELTDPRRSWPRQLILKAAFDEAVEIVHRGLYVPAFLLPDDLQELFEYGPSLSLGDQPQPTSDN